MSTSGDTTGRDARAGFSGTGRSGGTTRRYQRFGPQDTPDLDRVLLTVGAATAPSASSPFEIRIPDVKVHVRVVLAIGQLSGAAVDPNTTANTAVTGANVSTLWLASRAQLKAQANAQLVPPTRNLVGTAAAPQTIPTDTRLWGFEVELETAAEQIRGLLSVSDAAPATFQYQWHLQVYYQSLFPLPDYEWAKALELSGIIRGDEIRTGF